MDLKLIGDLILCAGIVCGMVVMVWAAVQKPGNNDD